MRQYCSSKLFSFRKVMSFLCCKVEMIWLTWIFLSRFSWFCIRKIYDRGGKNCFICHWLGGVIYNVMILIDRGNRYEQHPNDVSKGMRSSEGCCSLVFSDLFLMFLLFTLSSPLVFTFCHLPPCLLTLFLIPMTAHPDRW